MLQVTIPSGRKLDVWVFYGLLEVAYIRKGNGGQPHQLPSLSDNEINNILLRMGVLAEELEGTKDRLIGGNFLERLVDGYRPSEKGVRQYRAIDRRV